MRKRISILLTAVFLVSLSLAANAAVKPGTSCKKLGSTSIFSGKKYTCVKSGSRLVWNKGIKISKPTPAPTKTTSPDLEDLEGKSCTNEGEERTTFYLWVCRRTTTNSLFWYRKGYEPQTNPTSSPSPTTSTNPLLPPIQIKSWQSLVETNDLIYSATIKFNEWQSIQRGSAMPTEYLFEDSLPTEIKIEIRRLIDFAQKLMGNEGVKNLTVISGTTSSWMNEQIKAKKIGDRNPSYPDGYKIEYCSSDAVANIGCGDGRSSVLLLYKTPQNYFRLTERNGPIHEYFHLIQSALEKEKPFNYSKEFPGWFFEGAPSFFSSAILERMEIAAHINSRRALLNVGTYGKYPRQSLDHYYQNEFPGKYIYGIGQAAVEYIVASSSVDSILNIYRFIGEGDAFDTAFSKSTGITLSQFYAFFDEIQDSIGIYD